MLWASVGGSISGVVADQSGSVVANAHISVKETNTGLTYDVHSDSKGHYTFPVLPVGHYELSIDAPGFQRYERNAIVLDTNAALTLNASLGVGGVAQSVTVTDNTLHVETTSTQLGQVITGRQMTSVPLDGRSFTDLLSLQPGVTPQTAITDTTVQDVGATVLNPSGTLNPGNLSVNGQRETSNYFNVNGSDVEEDVNAGAAVIPNLDSIAEFRMITSNFDAEYGEFSGGQISVITKSGTNQFHGGAFDFLRNTDLDARNYFSPTRGAFQQNQFGGVVGGPIRWDKLFFFLDYQGTRQTQGIDTGAIAVPSGADRTGNLSDLTTGSAGNQLTGLVSGPYFANILTQRLGYQVVSGEPYYSPGCVSASTCVFPNAVIPQSAWSVPAQRMLQYIPAPNTAQGTFATSSFDQTVRDDKAGARVDANTRWGLISAYYFIDDFDLVNPYPVAQSGASVPGFSAATTGRAQLISLGDTKTFGAATVNELRLSFMRDNTNLGQPIGGRGVTLASQGFVNPDGTNSIVALDPKGQSVENLNFNGYSTGAAANQLIQVNDTYQVSDNFSKVVGNHTMKFGGEFHADQVNATPIAQFNGNFVFAGQETGVDFADFLVGVPSMYNQSQLNPFFDRNKYFGVFAQDSWRALQNLTLNYGLRWDRIAPWSEKYNQISTFVPGAQSVVFPGAPPGILYPGDPGIPNTLAPIDSLDFSPRVGAAWSPNPANGLFRELFGAPGATSVRAGFGLFYTAIDATSIGVLAANPPYGTTYSSPEPPLFATPFTGAADGSSNPQPFPYTFAPLNSSRSHPDANINWPTYEPISGIPGYDIRNHTPYTEQWSLSVERQAGPKTVLDASYVGSATHRQRVLVAENTGNPTLCLSLSQPSEVMLGTVTCGAFGEDTTYFPSAGGVVNGTRQQLGPNFGSNALQSNIGHANYNALQLSARHTAGRLEFDAAYTFSKSMDLSSNIGEEVNPFNHALSYAISAFDVKHNFVVSYDYQLPFDQLFRPNRLTRGWSLSGITHIASGFPVTMINNGDNSLIGTNPNGVNNSSIDEPDYDGGPIHLGKNPRTNGNQFFNTSSFSMNALGDPGTSRRRFFYGPGADNYDMAVAKNLPFTESRSVLFRVEAFNIFNHTQFNGPQSVDGNIGDTTFGQVISAASPRILQGALKFSF
jgi:hypothetical protein